MADASSDASLDPSDVSNILGPMSSLAQTLRMPISLILQLGVQAPQALAQMAALAGAKAPTGAPNVGTALDKTSGRPPILTPEEQHPQGFNIQWGRPPGPLPWPAGPGSPEGGNLNIEIGNPPATPPAPAPPTPTPAPSVATLNAATPSAVPGIPGEAQIDQSPNVLNAGPGAAVAPATTPAASGAAAPTTTPTDPGAAMMALGKTLSGIEMPKAPTPLPSGGVIHPTPVGTNPQTDLINALTAARTPPALKNFL